MNEKPLEEQRASVIQDALRALVEFYDAGVILVSFVENGETRRVQRGFGNYYAQLGLAHEFIRRDTAATNVDVENQLRDDEEAL